MRPLAEIINEMWRANRVPTIKRQVMLPSSPTPVQDGSILSTAVPVTQLREQYVKVCIYGRNRSGKTTLAAQFPKPLLFVSCEPAHCGGVQSVANMKDVTLIQVDDKPDPRAPDRPFGRKLVESVGEALHNSRQYKTVVLKTVTSLQDVVLEEMKREFPGLPLMGRGAKDTWGMRSGRLQDALRPMLDLKHVHVVVIAQEKDHNPPTGEGGFPDLKAKLLHTMQQGSFMAPALGPANAQWLQDACGYVLQLYEDEVTEEVLIPMNNPDGTQAAPVKQRVGTGKRQRHLRLMYHPNFAAGGKWNYDPDMPEFITAPSPQELYRALAAYIPALV